MTNKFYGIGVGVGDPEQITIKAVNTLKKLDVVIVPEAKKAEGSTAYEIAKEYLKDDIEIVFMEFPMLKNPLDRIEGRKANARVVEKLLDEGKNVGFLTIGDTMTYSTYVYLLENMEDRYKSMVETIPGISSFADMSSRFNFPIVMGDESLKIISINEDTDIEKELADSENIVFMKVMRNFNKLKEALIKTNNMNNIIMVSNSGKNTEEVFYDITYLNKEDIPYFTTMIFKKGGFEEWKKVFFIGAGPGDPELITVKGQKIVKEADIIIYAGSLVPKEVINCHKEGAEIYNSASMTLEEVMEVTISGIKAGKKVARVHTGDPAIFGAHREQMDILDKHGIEYEVIPGVSSFLASAAAVKKEFTLPSVSQTVICTRLEGRTPVPEKESLESLATHRASMAIFLSVHMIGDVVKRLATSYPMTTPIAVVQRASWPDEKIVVGTLETIEAQVKEAGISKTAQILVGDFLGKEYEKSKLYDKTFTHEFRKGVE